MIDHTEFLSTLFPTLTPSEHVSVTEIPKGGFITDALATGKDFSSWDPETPRAMYFCVSTTNGKSRTRDNLVRSHVLMLDDIGDKTAEPGVEPTYKLETSPGSFHWGYNLVPTADVTRFEALVEIITKDLGFGDKGAGGSYRLARLPGSTNVKDGKNNFKSVITDWHPDRVWELDELASEFGVDLNNVKTKRKPVSRVETKDNIDPLLDWLSADNRVISDGGEWVEVACPWASTHTDGSTAAGYSPLGRGAEGNVDSRGFNCFHEHCKTKNIGDYITWAKSVGGPDVTGYDPLPWLQERYAYLGMDEKVVDLHQRKLGGSDWLWDLRAWGRRHPGYIEKIRVADAFVASHDTKHADFMSYVPVKREEDTGMVKVYSQTAVNVYVPPNWDEIDDLPEVFIEHMEYLIPDTLERELFVDWLAYKFQNPDRRSYAMLMVADRAFGIGRSWIKTMLAATLQSSVNTATLGQLIGRGTSAEQSYNDWQSRTQFICIEEARESTDKDVFYQAYETFKTNVDPAVGVGIRINPKYGKTRTENIYYNALIFSNHKDAIAIPANDRRICVIKNPTTMESSSYYERLARSITSGEPQRIYWYLMRRDVSGFDNIIPPMTPGKQDMISANVMPSDEIWSLIENQLPDLVTKITLQDAVVSGAAQLRMDGIANKPRAVAAALWADIPPLRDEKNGARYRVGPSNSQAELKAVRNVEEWTKKDDERSREVMVVGMSR